MVPWIPYFLAVMKHNIVMGRWAEVNWSPHRSTDVGGRGIETKTRGKEGSGEKICNFSSFTHPGQQRDGERKVLGTGYAILVHVHPDSFPIRLQLHFFPFNKAIWSRLHEWIPWWTQILSLYELETKFTTHEFLIFRVPFSSSNIP